MKMKKQQSITFRKLLCLVLIIVSCICILPTVSVSAASAKLNQTSLTLSTYHTFQLKVKNAKKVKWSSSNSAIATVSDEGLVTANAAGTANIYAKVDKKKLTCKVKVVAYDRHIERAAYGTKAMKDLLGSDAQISNIRYGNFMNGIEFSYFECSYKNALGKTQTCYVYIYPQEQKNPQQLNVNTTLYGNLVIKIESLEMERMMKDRSKELKQSEVNKCLSVLKKTETIKYKKGSDFKEIHQWMNL